MLGKYPEISLICARKLRDEARGLAANGIDPSTQRKAHQRREAAEQKDTFAILAAELLEKKRKEGRAEATLTKTEWLHRLLNADIGHMPVTKITAQDVHIPLRKMEKKGNLESAKRLRSAAGAVFRYAIALGKAENDPTYGLKDALIQHKVTHRAAITNPNEVGALMRAIDDFSGQRTTRLALHLISITSVRPGELRLAKWD